jgi:S-adenosylmethionine hydrolase
MKRIIAILTDFGKDSIFVGEIKGVILKINPNAIIVDLTHEVSPQNIVQGAFLLKSSYRFFPKGTIFMCVIDPEVGSDRRAIVVRTKNYIFVGPDNGLLYPAVTEDGIDSTIVIKKPRYILSGLSKTFHGRDVFAPVVGYLSNGLQIRRLGTKTNFIEALDLLKPHFEGGTVFSDVIFVDVFGNVVTNITRTFLHDMHLNDIFSITLTLGSNSFRLPLVESYSMAEEGSQLVLFNSFGCLEIAVNKGNASKYFGIGNGDKLKFRFNN